MKLSYLLFVIAGILIGAAVVLAMKSPTSHEKHTEDKTATETHEGHSMPEVPADAVVAERMFLEMMIPHHEEAVASSRTVLRQGGSTKEVRDLAQAIIIAQEDEITLMKEWYQTWYGKAYSDTGVYTPMMRDISALQGSALDAVFLEDMVQHHLHAITMAHDISKTTQRPELLTLAQNIAADQSNEIVTMKTLLKQLSTSTVPTL